MGVGGVGCVTVAVTVPVTVTVAVAVAVTVAVVGADAPLVTYEVIVLVTTGPRTRVVSVTVAVFELVFTQAVALGENVVVDTLAVPAEERPGHDTAGCGAAGERLVESSRKDRAMSIAAAKRTTAPA